MRCSGFVEFFLCLKINDMRLFIKSENEEGEIEFYRTDNGELMVSILNGHGSTYYILNNNEVDSLISYINLTDERLD